MSVRQLALRMLAVGVTGAAVWCEAACAEPGEKVRPAYNAGSWYPGDPEVLAKQVDDLLAAASPLDIAGKPRAVIVPHAGYRFSGPVAAAAYRCLQGHTYKRVIVLALSHRNASSYDGVDVPRDLTAYQTPLGQVPQRQRVFGGNAKWLYMQAGKL